MRTCVQQWLFGEFVGVLVVYLGVMALMEVMFHNVNALARNQIAFNAGVFHGFYNDGDEAGLRVLRFLNTSNWKLTGIVYEIEKQCRQEAGSFPWTIWFTGLSMETWKRV